MPLGIGQRRIWSNHPRLICLALILAVMFINIIVSDEISKKCYKPWEGNNSFMLLHMLGQSGGRISDKFA